ncbi:MAG: RagB/SusD family nutrient uptake outer membrane protein, partial [Rikenellaceae bacterium]|nr:RagB/SusD family nutrient uptake outer membrane protein [Rikenellaceae bacterium]
MKKRILGYMLTAAAMIFTAGCSDFLEIKNYGDPAESWEDENDVDKAIAGLFEFTITESVSGRGMFWFEVASDDIVPGRTRATADAIKEFKMDASNSEDAKENWAKMYQYVARANNILSMVPTMDKLSDSYKTQAVGIAYFFRGLYMLWIAPYYGDNGPNGGIPIVLETTNAGDIDSPRPTSVLMNYDQIISDMRNAAERLPLFSELPSDLYGYPHKAAAWAFGARAALYAAQYDASYYDIVLEFCNNIENLTGADKRELFDDGSANPFKTLWTKAQNFGSEYIFSMLGNAVEGPKFHGVSFHNGGYSIINTWGYFQPTVDLYEAFETGDTRREATILLPGEEMTFVGNTFI